MYVILQDTLPRDHVHVLFSTKFTLFCILRCCRCTTANDWIQTPYCCWSS